MGFHSRTPFNRTSLLYTNYSQFQYQLYTVELFKSQSRQINRTIKKGARALFLHNYLIQPSYCLPIQFHRIILQADWIH